MGNAASEGLGLTGFDSFHFLVGDLERSHQFYTRLLDWPLVARSNDALTERSAQKSHVYAAGNIQVVVSTPQSARGRAATYLRSVYYTQLTMPTKREEKITGGEE